MDITVRQLGNGVAVVQPQGRLNMVSAGQLRETVNAEVLGGRPKVVIDMSLVTFIDSSGLGALISGLKTARQAGGDLRISSPNDQAKLVLRLTNMERVLIAHDVADSAYDNG